MIKDSNAWKSQALTISITCRFYPPCNHNHFQDVCPTSCYSITLANIIESGTAAKAPFEKSS